MRPIKMVCVVFALAGALVLGWLAMGPTHAEVAKAWESSYTKARYTNPKANVSNVVCFPMVSKGVVACTANVDIVATYTLPSRPGLLKQHDQVRAATWFKWENGGWVSTELPGMRRM